MGKCHSSVRLHMALVMLDAIFSWMFVSNFLMIFLYRRVWNQYGGWCQHLCFSQDSGMPINDPIVGDLRIKQNRDGDVTVHGC